jgi:steroid delta-isomerase-like uncharacterized protein
MGAKSTELSRRIFEDVWNRKNLNAVDELMSADYLHHDASSPAVPRGIDGYKQFVNYYISAFPDAHFTIDDAFSDGTNEVTRWTVSGTHEGDLAGIPRTGRRFSITGITIARIVNGKATESWNSWDALGMMQQLGVVPAGAKGRAA